MGLALLLSFVYARMRRTRIGFAWRYCMWVASVPVVSLFCALMFVTHINIFNSVRVVLPVLAISKLSLLALYITTRRSQTEKPRPLILLTLQYGFIYILMAIISTQIIYFYEFWALPTWVYAYSWWLASGLILLSGGLLACLQAKLYRVSLLKVLVGNCSLIILNLGVSIAILMFVQTGTYIVHTLGFAAVLLTSSLDIMVWRFLLTTLRDSN